MEHLSNWKMPCPKCGSLKKNQEGFGSMHSHGWGKKGDTSTYIHECGECGCSFKKIYDYGNNELIIMADKKVISIDKKAVPDIKKAIRKELKIRNRLVG